MQNNAISINSVLSKELTFCGQNPTSKKKALEQIAQQVTAQYPQLNEDLLFNSLVNRERLGSTGIGQGIAIPHCRTDGSEEVLGILMTLQEPISFDSIDNEPVDILFALIVPEEATSEHLDLLGKLAEKFNNSDFCNKLRACRSSQELYQTMVD